MVKYSTITLAYGALHSLVNLWDRKGSYHNYAKRETEKRQLLFVDKLIYAGVITISAPMCWPFLLYHDLKRAETPLRWKDAENFNNFHPFLE